MTSALLVGCDDPGASRAVGCGEGIECAFAVCKGEAMRPVEGEGGEADGVEVGEIMGVERGVATTTKIGDDGWSWLGGECGSGGRGCCGKC